MFHFYSIVGLVWLMNLLNTVYSDIKLQDVLSEIERDEIGVKEVLDATIAFRREVHLCNTQEVIRMDETDSCTWRYFEVKTSNLDKGTDAKCTTIELKARSLDFTPEICYSLSDAFWYGGSELRYQRWPIKETSLQMQPFVTNDIYPSNTTFGNVIDRFWINSKGIGIMVDDGVPLSVSVNDSRRNKICFQNNIGLENIVSETVHESLKFVICKAASIKDIFNLYASRPNGIPDERMFKSPIWSTWAKYKVAIDQTKVFQYANEIIDHGFSNSQIEIDDMFSNYYGDFDFTPKKFENPKEMMSKLKEQGFRVTVWITPFANLDSVAFIEGLEKGYWLKDITGEVPALVKWWQGIGAILDIENEEAVRWYIDRLKTMKDTYGIDSFKFDAGEVTYLPPIHEYTSTWSDPSMYTTKYVAAVSKLGPMIEVRCGYKTQEIPVFVRMGDKDSIWGFNNGLQSLIPTVLTMGILGYPYILPDMIGGNGYVTDLTGNFFFDTQLPDRELYIRWLQVTAYLPAMQFSFVPWQYDDEVVSIARKFVKIHEEEVTPIVLQAAQEAMKSGDQAHLKHAVPDDKGMVEIMINHTGGFASILSTAQGAPLIRPLWWIDPHDIDALECETEFLVGDILLVAPVVEKGTRKRNIYLPRADWEDRQKGDTIKGGRWLFNYPAAIDEVPTFKRIK